MSYRVFRFQHTNLPVYNVQMEVGTGPTAQRIVPLTDGQAYDGYGTEQAELQLPYQITLRGEEIGTQAAIRTAIDNYRALRGIRANLYRQVAADATVQFVVARLDRLTQPRTWENIFFQPIELQFSIWSAWRGVEHGHTGPWYFNTSGYYFDEGRYFDIAAQTTTLDSSPKTVTVNNAGNTPVINAVIYVAAGVAAITYLKINNAKTGYPTTEWEFTGTIAAGTTLVIDCGARSVLNNSVNAYADFALTANHASNHWFSLWPGDNSVIVTKTGGGTVPTIRLAYYDGWE